MMRRVLLGVTAIGLALGGGSTPVSTQGQPLGFFITSAGKGDGANLGGLAGADAHCQTLAKAAGAGARQWRAYLSASAAGGQAAVNAKDRIGSGPWYNAKGVLIAQNVADLHNEATTKVGKENSLTEKGTVYNGRGDTPNKHDILTGSNMDGTLATAPATPPAATGPATRATAAPWSATTIGRAAAPTPTRGTRPIRPRAAARRTWSPPAATATSTASRRSSEASGLAASG